jgi:hypothetical protein
LTGHDVYDGPALAASNKMKAVFKISMSFWGVRVASCSLHVIIASGSQLAVPK